MNKDDYIMLAEKFLAGLMHEVDLKGEYSVIVPIDDRWEHPLPENLAAPKGGKPGLAMTVAITNWSRENSFYDYESGELTIVTAFGDDENSAVFSSLEIFAVLDPFGNTIYAKPYAPFVRKPKEEPKEYSVKAMIQDHEVNQTSMDAMRKNNPGMFKKGK